MPKRVLNRLSLTCRARLHLPVRVDPIPCRASRESVFCLGFRDEKEFRLLFDEKDEIIGPHHITIEPSWVLRVIVNPWLSDDLVPGIAKLLKSFPGFSRLRVDKSSLINSSQWKEACERVDEFAQILDPPPLKI